MGKGSKQRPMRVSREEYERRWDKALKGDKGEQSINKMASNGLSQ
jgi:hypothetical protein